jgi:hypothetical protein
MTFEEVGVMPQRDGGANASSVASPMRVLTGVVAGGEGGGREVQALDDPGESRGPCANAVMVRQMGGGARARRMADREPQPAGTAVKGSLGADSISPAGDARPPVRLIPGWHPTERPRRDRRETARPRVFPFVGAPSLRSRSTSLCVRLWS